MLTNSRDIIRRLDREGWTLLRVTGSHHVFRNPRTGEKFVAPYPKKRPRPCHLLISRLDT